MTGQPTSRPDYSILSAFQPVVARPRSSILYQFSLLLVALTMLILPMIYFALVGAVIWVVFYHAIHSWPVLMKLAVGGGPLAYGLMFLCYLLPVVVGIAIVIAMLKPLFAGRLNYPQPLALNPADNPLLYAFIAKVCDSVGAPSPRRIDLDCHINASVSFRRGLASMTGDDLVLTIGLPLVANLTAAEFAGVVAHEFGHFNQRVGLRLSYLIRALNRWFFRAVYQRDAWDNWLREKAENADSPWVVPGLWLLQILVFGERMILSALMHAGLLIGGFMVRQMEYEADACEIRLVGSETFERTCRKLATLDAAAQHMRRQMRRSWRSAGQLPDNLCELLRQAHESMPQAVIARIEASYGMRRTSLFDSHPSPADRIQRARQMRATGSFHDERPATALFSSFEHPARFVTQLFYSDELGIPITREMLLRVETKGETAVDANRENPLDAVETHSEYFLGVLPLILPLQISTPMASSDYERDFTEVTQLTTGLRQVAEQLASIGEQYQQASEQLIQARVAIRLLEARVPIKAEEFGLDVASLDAAQAREVEALTTRDSSCHSVHEVRAALQRRLQLGLALKLADSGGLAGDSNAADRVLPAVTQLQTLAGDYPTKRELAEALAVLDRLIQVRDDEGESPMLARALAAQLAAVNSFRPQPSYLPAEVHAHPKAHLVLARKPKDGGAAELDLLRNQTRQWFANYQDHLDLLVEFAQAGESPVAG